MSKSGKGMFYMGKLQPKPAKLSKGRKASFDHVRKEFLKKVFAMKLSGKSDEEILDWLEAQVEQGED